MAASSQSVQPPPKRQMGRVKSRDGMDRVAALCIVIAAAIGAALWWPGDIAANAVVPLTLIALYLIWLLRR